jgi:hypothetical protein
LFTGKPQASAFNVVDGLKRRRLRLAVKQLFLPYQNASEHHPLEESARSPQSDSVSDFPYILILHEPESFAFS